MHDSIKAAKFLRLFRKKGFINLVAIHPLTSAINGITRDINSTDLDSFIKKYNGFSNLYFMVNEPDPFAPDDKLKKEHVKFIHALFLDADPIKENDFTQERQRLKSFAANLNNSNTPPSYVVDSGGGYQAFWLLDIPLTAEFEHEAESYGRGLADLHNTDAVQNIDRVMRLPFTLNIPNKKKLELGRKEAIATVVHAKQTHYSFDTLKTLCHPKEAPEYNDIGDYNLDMSLLKDHLDIDIKLQYQDLLASDEKLRALINQDIKKPSRSEYDFAIMQRLKMANWDIQDAAQVLWCCDAGKGNELTKRELTRAYARAENPREVMALDANTVALINAQINPSEPVKPIRKYKAIGKISHRNAKKPILKGLLDQSTIVAFYGQSNIGKSFVVTDMLAHVCLGKDWAGYKNKAPGSVLYVAGEGAANSGPRGDALKMRMGFPIDCEITDFPFGVMDDHIDIMYKDEKNGVYPGVEEIIAQAAFLSEDSGKQCRIIAIDTLNSVFGGKNENSADDMGLAKNNLMVIAARTGCTIVIVHHSGKDQAAGLRGHSSLLGTLDGVFEVKVSDVGTKLRRELIPKKQRDNDKNLSIEFNLNIVEVGLDEDGDAITSCSIILQTDSEFSPIIPDILAQLTEGQKIAYKTVAICQYTKNSDIQQFYGWYYFVSKHPEMSIEELQSEHSRTGSRMPLSSRSDLIKSDTVREQCGSLSKKGIIEKNEKDQWVIV